MAGFGRSLAGCQSSSARGVDDAEQLFKLLDLIFGFDVRSLIESDADHARVRRSVEFDRVVTNVSNAFRREAQSSERLGVGFRLRHQQMKIT